MALFSPSEKSSSEIAPDNLPLDNIPEEEDENPAEQSSYANDISSTNEEKEVTGFKKTFSLDQKMREYIQKATPEFVRSKLEKQKLEIIRKWLMFITFMCVLFTFVNLANKKDPLPMWM